MLKRHKCAFKACFGVQTARFLHAHGAFLHANSTLKCTDVYTSAELHQEWCNSHAAGRPGRGPHVHLLQPPAMPTPMSQRMSLSRMLIRSLVVLLLVCVAGYGADWAAWRVRVARGRGTEEMQVSRVTVTPLKGSKEEYDFAGTDTVVCTESLLPQPVPQGWSTPCWWLARHPQVVVRY